MEAWGHRGGPLPLLRPPFPEVAPPGSAPPVDVMIANPDVLIAWLRGMEPWLQAGFEIADQLARPAGPVLRAVLPELVLAYGDASDEQRQNTRLAFSRFRLALYHLSGFAGQQALLVGGPDGVLALRRALLAESLLDQGTDWRDELLMLRDLRRDSRAAGLPFNGMVAEAASCSTARTAEFLLAVVREQTG